ncbi:MAG: ribonuclease III [Candidatus Latescibacteria bacterium]|nr:ribonuclease III [Candidatus Latescibacterota bacterium]NIM20975.1 ribonuclease III [Candidatus Latescibacterota bacterium]NIM65110.1 ribonuclease III [Candidatus Latescibacterota bacterium]NIO01625.1 ribonuclease III [Candidatus Latescibacterota bacterium]NIO28142.1 ribonuclease III [Candidatus Latescibacterota bacterium]
MQQALGYQFQNPQLLVEALVHRSYLPTRENEEPEQRSNERMEFLGDSVLSLVVNEFLYIKYPSKSEGELTKMKSIIVSKQILSDHAKKHNIGSFIFLSDNAQKAGVSEVDSVLADTLEAIFGAIFLDGGFEQASRIIQDFLLSGLGEIVYDDENVNYKSLLQEYIQALHKIPPRYRVYSTQGPDHDKEFGVEVSVRGTILGRGTGKTKKHAEQEAAREAYRKLLNSPGSN